MVYFDLPQLAWIGADSGIAVSPFDVTELSTAISRLAHDESLRASLGRGARERSSAYDSDVTGERYRALVAELLGST